MATKAGTNAVYAAGPIQGIALVTFPAASTIFTSPSQYGLSNTQYGTMFLPQVVTAITGSLLGGKLAARFGIKRLHALFVAGAVAAVIMGGLSFALARKSPAKVMVPASTS